LGAELRKKDFGSTSSHIYSAIKIGLKPLHYNKAKKNHLNIQIMTKEKNSKKESAKKQPLLNLKEKRAAKEMKRQGKNDMSIDIFRTNAPL